DPTDALAPGADTQSLVRYRDVVANVRIRHVVAHERLRVGTGGEGEFLHDNRRDPETPVPRVPNFLLSTEWVSQHADEIFILSGVDDVEWRAVVTPILLSDGSTGGALLIASSTEEVNKVMRQFVVIFSG